MPVKTCGQFSMEGGVLTASRTYMEEQGNALVDKILAGDDMIFNMTSGQSPDVETAILVRLQTDYAGWIGFKEVEGWLSHGHQQ